ncbi:MAG: hypothetical protein SFV21_06570 [Rhodospirillaceae bacterium]|nr:hypothetical protein [Rhodospirillaceae bacterium]
MRAAGLRAGEEVELRTKGGDLVVHRPAARARDDARKAAAEIRRHAQGRSLRGLSIKDLINDGRRARRAPISCRAD